MPSWLQCAMQFLEDWSGAFQSAGIMAQVILTGVIALLVHRYSRRVDLRQMELARATAEVETDRAITDNLMRMNFEMYANPELAELYQRKRHKGEDTDYLRTLAQTRWRLALLAQIWQAQEKNIVADARQRYGFDDLVGLLIRTDVKAFKFAWEAEGFDAEFRSLVEQRAKAICLKDPSIFSDEEHRIVADMNAYAEVARQKSQPSSESNSSEESVPNAN